MPALTLKNIPDELYQNLKRQAVLHHRSLNSEIIVTLEQAVQHPKSNLQEVLKEARRLRAKTTKYQPTEKELKAAKQQGRL